MHRFLVGWLLLTALLPAQAEQLRVTFGSEYFSWREYDGGSKLLEETGPRFFLGIEAENAVSSQWLYGFRGRLYGGSVSYQGQAQELSPPFLTYPHDTTSSYSGWSAEVDFTRQFLPHGAHEPAWGISFALGYDNWRRRLADSYNRYFDSIVAGYAEDYQVGYGRLGLVFSPAGWSLQGGVKLPFFTSESVGLTRLGFDNDPVLKPQPDYSLYASLSYRLNPRWDVGGYYDSYRFLVSDDVPVELGGTLFGYFYQPKSQQDSIGFYLNYRF